MDEKIVVKVVADTSDFNNSISKIEQQTTNATKKTQNGVNNVSSNVQGAVNSIKTSIQRAIGITLPALGIIGKRVKGIKDSVSNIKPEIDTNAVDSAIKSLYNSLKGIQDQINAFGIDDLDNDFFYHLADDAEEAKKEIRDLYGKNTQAADAIIDKTNAVAVAVAEAGDNARLKIQLVRKEAVDAAMAAAEAAGIEFDPWNFDYDAAIKGLKSAEEAEKDMLDQLWPELQDEVKKTTTVYNNFLDVLKDTSVYKKAAAAHDELKKKIKDTSAYKKASTSWEKLKAQIKDTSVYKKASAAWKKMSDTFDKDNLKGAKERLEKLTKYFTTLIAVLAILSASLVMIAKKVATLGDSVDKGSQRLNMTVEQYQKWSYAMDLCGSSIDELRSAYGIFARQVGYASNGTKASVQAFQNLGVSIYDANGALRGTGDIFEDTILKLQQIENATERQAQAQQLFGRSTASLNPLLNSEKGMLEQVLKTQNALGSQMDQALVKRSALYVDSIATMKQAWQGLKNTIAGAVLPVIINVVHWLTIAIAKIRIFISAIFGIKTSGDAVSKSMKTASASVGGYGGALQKAASAAKELKRQTMGFDELNVMQGPDSGSGGSSDTDIDDYDMDMGGGGAVSDLGALLSDEDIANIEKFQNKMDGIKDKVGGWVAALGILGGAILMVLGGLTCNIPMLIGGAALAGIGVAAANGSSEDGISPLIEGIVIALGAFAGALAIVTVAQTAFNVALTANPIGLIIAAVAALVAGFVMLWNKCEGFRNFFIKLWDGIVKAIKPVVDELVDIFKRVWADIKEIWDVVAPYFQLCWDAIKKIFSVVVDILGGFFKAAWSSIKIVWNVAGDYFKNSWATIAAVFSVVKNVLSGDFSAAWDAIKNIVNKWRAFFVEVWAGIKAVFANVATFFKDTFTKAWTAVKTVFSTGGKIFSGIKEGIENTFRAVVNKIISGINTVVAVPFNAINKMLNKIKDASFLGIAPFKNKWSYDPLAVPKIPMLAKGGVVTQSTLVNIGEAGKEAVLPLDNNTGWMDMLADRISARNQTPTKIVLAIDGKEFGYAAIDNINNITTQTGALQLKFA